MAFSPVATVEVPLTAKMSATRHSLTIGLSIPTVVTLEQFYLFYILKFFVCKTGASANEGLDALQSAADAWPPRLAEMCSLIRNKHALPSGFFFFFLFFVWIFPSQNFDNT